MGGDATSFVSIDEGARRRFESAWKQGRPEPIESCLPAEDQPHYLPTLEELVHIELEFRWKTPAVPAVTPGPPRVEAYLERFPRLNQPDVVFRLLKQECLVRQRHGDRPDSGEFRARFPHLDWGGPGADTLFQGDAAGGPAAGPGSADVGDRYRLCAEHARGGFGLVWRAEDRTLGREVALKQLSGDLAVHGGHRQRFVAEARIAGRLQHPGIVPVYDLGGEAGPHPYYTMKLVQGQTLAEAIRLYHQRPADDPERAVEHLRLLSDFVAVTRAVAYAHSRRVIHRDLKPANILLGDFGEVVVLDWGLAKVLGDAEATPLPRAGGAADATRAGTVLGTPAYMAPEQAAGDLARVDEQSDVYALGAILYQILTGRRPYQGNSSEAVLHAVLNDDPPPPRTVDPRVPRALDAVCRKAMARRKEDRYASADELTRDLERYLADEPVAAYRASLAERLGRWGRRHFTAVVAGGVAVLLLTVAGVAGGLVWQRVRQEMALRDAQELQARQADAESAERAALQEMLRGRWRQARQFVGQALERVEPEPRLAGLRTRLEDRNEQVFHLLEFTRLSERAWFLAGEERDAAARAAATAALEHAGVWRHTDWAAHLPTADLDGSQKQQLVRDNYRLLLLVALLQVKPVAMNPLGAGAGPACEQALATVAKAHAHRPSQIGFVVETICRLRLGQKPPPRPAAVGGPADAVDTAFLGLMYFWVGNVGDDLVGRFVRNAAQAALGVDFTDANAKAQAHLKEAVRLEPQNYWHQFMLYMALMAARNDREAELVAGTCVALRPDYARGFEARGTALLAQSQSAAGPTADELVRRAREDFDQALRLAPYDAYTFYIRADFLSQLNRPAEAVDACFRAVELDEEAYARLFDRRQEAQNASSQPALEGSARLCAGYREQDPRNADVIATLAAILAALGRHDEAWPLAEQALAARPDHVRARTVQGAVLVRRKQWEAARDAFAAALTQAPGQVLARAGRAQAYEALGRMDEALADFDRLLEAAVNDWQRREAHLGRARALARLGRTADARHALDQARLLDPTLADEAARALGLP